MIRRDLSGGKSHQVTVVPTGSSQSSRVGNKAADVFDEEAVGASVSIQVITREASKEPIGRTTHEEFPENKTGIVRCDLIDCANNFKDITTMPALSLCQKFLKNILATLHLYHQKSLIDGKRLARTVLIFTGRSDQLSRATDRVPGLPTSPGYAK